MRKGGDRTWATSLIDRRARIMTVGLKIVTDTTETNGNDRSGKGVIGCPRENTRDEQDEVELATKRNRVMVAAPA